jgi:hypothetical protein
MGCRARASLNSGDSMILSHADQRRHCCLLATARRPVDERAALMPRLASYLLNRPRFALAASCVIGHAVHHHAFSEHGKGTGSAGLRTQERLSDRLLFAECRCSFVLRGELKNGTILPWFPNNFSRPRAAEGWHSRERDRRSVTPRSAANGFWHRDCAGTWRDRGRAGAALGETS